MDESILNSTKKTLGLAPDYDVFDQDILMHINTALSTLTQLGVGPSDGFAIFDGSELWDDFLHGDKRLNMVKTYIYLRVRVLFDPPGTSFVLEAIKNQISELEWRINVAREETDYINPFESVRTR